MINKAVLITGSNRGIGLALAKGYAEKGCTVLATCIDPENAPELRLLTQQYPAVTVLPLDVTDPVAINKIVTVLKNKPIDILINNAGIRSGINPQLTAIDQDPSQTLGSIDPAGLEKIFRVNFIAPIMVTQALLPNLLDGTARKIAMISSGYGSITKMDEDTPLGYGASKAALNAATKNIALALQSERFVVVALNPGWVRTDMGSQQATLAPEESASRLIHVIEELTPDQTGQFLRHTGENIAW